MPGISGLIDLSGKTRSREGVPHAETIAAMIEAMRYEPFYASRQYGNQDAGVYLGWVGEAGKTGSSGPVADKKAGLILFASRYAEIPDQETSEGNGQGLRILNLYERIGEEFPDRIERSIAGCLVDERRKRCFLFSDRLGMERIFLYVDDEKVLFSSEAKAILAVVPETREFDPVGLGQFFACGCTLGENSLYRNIRVLPGGSVMKFVKGSATRVLNYFDYSKWEKLKPLGEREFLAAFCETLKKVVGTYTRRPLQTAVSLTGGLDSRMIMACMDAPEGTVPCYSFGSMYRETYDVMVARKVAERCRQPHSVLVLGKDFLRDFQHHLSRAIFISDGYLGFSGAAELYVNHLARQVAPYRLTGNYGGELLRGARAFKSSKPRGEFLKTELNFRVEEAMKDFSRLGSVRPETFTLSIQAPAGYGRYAIERSQVTLLSPFLDEKLIELIYQRPQRFADGEDPSIRVIDTCNPGLSEIPTDRGLLGGKNWSGRTARRIYREAMFKLEYWTGDGMPDGMARLSRFGPDAAYDRMFKGRHKFQHFRTWIQRECATCVGSILLGGVRTSLDEYIDFSRVKRMLAEHLSRQRNYTEEIDRLTTIVLADRLLLQQAAQQRSTGQRVAGER
jgi:asparagine synthase (glutamine-hydrolysing)